MLINKHELIHSKDAGGGYHGNCAYCGVALVTDLGYCSWEGVKCIDREIENLSDLPNQVLNYMNFKGYRWNFSNKIFQRPTFDNTEDNLTLKEAIKRVEDILK